MKTLVLLAALSSVEPTSPRPVPDLRQAMVATYVENVTACIGAHISASKNFGQLPIVELIVEEMKQCVAPARALVSFLDECYGKGVGEQYFLGPYLDMLPRRLDVWIKANGK